MILRSVRLENIRSYSSQSIVFPEGSTLLSGDIGAGKSTILLAIEFALFGLLRSEMTGASLLRHGKSAGSVELRFEIDKSDYIIKRTLKKTKDSVVQDSGYLITNGRKYEGTPVELKARILDILGYPEALVAKSKSMIYRYTVYTPQEDMKQILFEDKEERLDTLRRLFGIDKYRSISQNAELFIREMKRKHSEMMIKLEGADETEAEIKRRNEDLTKTQDLLSALDKEIMDSDEISKKEKKDLESLDAKIRRLNELKKKEEVTCALLSTKKSTKESFMKKLEEARSDIESLEKKLHTFKEAAEPISEKEIEHSLSRLEEKLSLAIKEKAAFSEKLRQHSSEISRLKKEIEDISKASKDAITLRLKVEEYDEGLKAKKSQEGILDELFEKEKKAISAIERTLQQIKDCEARINTLKESKICPTCAREIDELHRKSHLKELNSELAGYKDEKERLNLIMKKIADNISKSRRNLERLSELESRQRAEKERLLLLEEKAKPLVKMQKEFSELSAKLNEIEGKISSNEEEHIRKEIALMKSRLAEARSQNMMLREKTVIGESLKEKKRLMESLAKEIMHLEKEITGLSGELERTLEELSSFSAVLVDYEKKKAVFEERRESQKNAEIRRAALRQERKSASERLSELSKKLESYEQIKRKAKELSETKDWFENFFLGLMSNMEKHIMGSIHTEFTGLLKEWFSVMIEGIEISLDEEFTVRLTQDGYETGIDSLSGGEKTSVALAYRLALNKVINDLISGIKTKDLIILDEPTDGFSSEQLDKVREVLEMLGMGQMILVSHEPKLESYVQNIIRVEKAGNNSTISVI